MPAPSVLLIDDQADVLTGIRDELSALLANEEVVVKTWQPDAAHDDPFMTFNSYVDDTTLFVATDYDLSKGLKGLFGITIVGWCQKRLVPVGDFSRGNASALPREPELFELRIPSNDKDGARFIANAFYGFRDLKNIIHTRYDHLKTLSSPASILAHILNKPHIEPQLSLYIPHVSTVNSDILSIPTNTSTSDIDKLKINTIAYFLGHLLFNSILKFPGPILSPQALCAYCGTTTEEHNALASLFEHSSYTGPFHQSGPYYWRDGVDSQLDAIAKELSINSFEKPEIVNRTLCEAKLGRELTLHNCARPDCSGKCGGFLCPFTLRTVCAKNSCSIGTSSWIPQGADLCRVDHDFYEEWAPLLGF